MLAKRIVFFLLGCILSLDAQVHKHGAISQVRVLGSPVSDEGIPDRR